MGNYKRVFRVHLEAEPEGGYTVTVPALPGCVTWGYDYEHAMAMARECIAGFIEALIAVGETVPEDTIADEIDALIDITDPALV